MWILRVARFQHARLDEFGNHFDDLPHIAVANREHPHRPAGFNRRGVKSLNQRRDALVLRRRRGDDQRAGEVIAHHMPLIARALRRLFPGGLLQEFRNIRDRKMRWRIRLGNNVLALVQSIDEFMPELKVFGGRNQEQG